MAAPRRRRRRRRALVAEIEFTRRRCARRPRVHPSARVARRRGAGRRGAGRARTPSSGGTSASARRRGRRARRGRAAGPRVGARNRIFPFAERRHAAAGPQVPRTRPAQLVLGDDNIVREYASVQPGHGRGRHGDSDRQRLSAHGLCARRARLQLGTNVILANGGGARRTRRDRRLRHRRRARRGAPVRRASASPPSAPRAPWCRWTCRRSARSPATAPACSGSTLIGLRRRGFHAETIPALKRAYRLLFHGDRSGAKTAVARTRAAFGDVPEVARLLRLRRRARTRGVCAAMERRSGSASIAGSGRFPVVFAETARRRGVEVVAVAHRGETAPELVASRRRASPGSSPASSRP